MAVQDPRRREERHGRRPPQLQPFGGDYRARGSRLRFDELQSTLVGCEGPGAGTNVLRALDRTRAYRRTARRLVLLDGRGRQLARLRRR